MSYLDDRKPRRIHLHDEWWVDVRERLTVGQRANAQRWLTLTEVANVPGTTDVKLVVRPDTERYALYMVSGAIIEWNLTDADGTILPLEPEASRIASIQSIDCDDFDAIAREVERLNAPRSDNEQANFRSGDSGSASDERHESSPIAILPGPGVVDETGSEDPPGRSTGLG